MPTIYLGLKEVPFFLKQLMAWVKSLDDHKIELHIS